MTMPLRRATLRAVTTVALGAALALSGVVASTFLATSAQATTAPPWEVPQGSATEPAVYPNELGGLTFYNSLGQVITGGNISDDPIAAYVQGNTGLQTSGIKAELGGFTPVISAAPGAWNEVQFGNSAYPNASAPGALATSTLPLYTGVSGYSLSDLTTAYPNTDTTSDGYAGLYVLRLQAFQSPFYSTTYDSADISVNSNTGAWSLVYSPQAATTTTLETPTPASPQNSGTPVTLTADVTDPSAPGTVQFYSGTTAISSPQTVSDGVASLTTTALPVGTDSLSAVFTPTTGAAFSGSTSNSVSYVVDALGGATTTTLEQPSPDSGTYGSSVTLNATVTSTGGGTITGTVQFYSGTTAIGSPQTVSAGAASLTTTALPVGSPDLLSATYLPTTGNGFSGSTSAPVDYTVSPAPTTTTLGTPTPASPQFVGTTVTLNATVTSSVSGTIPGAVQFYSGGAPIGTPQTLSAGGASLTTGALPVGDPDLLTAAYVPSPSSVYATSTSSPAISYVVEPLNATTTTLEQPSPDSGTYGSSVTLNATVTSAGGGTITGTVQFYSGTTAIGTQQAVSAGAASLTTTALPVGSPDLLSASYVPTTGNGFSGSTSAPVDYTVSPAPTTTTLGTPTPASPQFVGTSVTLSATVTSSVSGAIAGAVQFYSGTTPIGTPRTLSGGAASLTTSALPVGDPDSLTATYVPSASSDYAMSTSSPAVSYVVEPLNATTTTLSASPPSPQVAGTSVTLNATVTSTGGGTITGTVQFYSGTTAIGSPQTVSAGAASLTTTALPVGSPDSLSAHYTPTGGNGFAASVGTASYTVTAVATTPPPPPAGATSSQGASSTTSSGTASASVSGISASGSGVGALTVATYSGNPVPGAVSSGTGVFDDVALSAGNTFASVTITVSDLGPGGQSIDWWNGSAWVPFSDQSYDAATHSVTAVVNATTSPTLAQLAGTEIAASSDPAPSRGYWEIASDGGLFAFGGAGFYGSEGGQPLNAPIVAVAATADGQGYWEVASDGGIFAFGDAEFYGSEGGQPLNKPIVGIAATPDGKGYWEVASDGGIFAFGDASFYGSEGGQRLNAPIVAIATTPDGGGYWEVASDGGIFAFGDAEFYGSEGGQALNKPIVAIAATPDGQGYWEVASDGGIFAFGDAEFYGSEGGQPLNKPIVGIATTSSGAGYWEVASDGGVFAFGSAGFFGSEGGQPLNKPIIGIAGA